MPLQLLALPLALVGLLKRNVKETFTADPSSNVINYMKFTAVMAGSIALKQYLEDQKIPLFFNLKNYLYNGQHSYHGGWSCAQCRSIHWRQLSGTLLIWRPSPSCTGRESSHDKALEAYQAAYAKYQKDRTKLLVWIATNDRIKDQVKQNFTNTDYTFILSNQAHQTSKSQCLSSLRSINPASSKNKANSCLSVLAPLHLGTLPFASFKKKLYLYISVP